VRTALLQPAGPGSCTSWQTIRRLRLAVCFLREQADHRPLPCSRERCWPLTAHSERPRRVDWRLRPRVPVLALTRLNGMPRVFNPWEQPYLPVDHVSLWSGDSEYWRGAQCWGSGVYPFCRFCHSLCEGRNRDARAPGDSAAVQRRFCMTSFSGLSGTRRSPGAVLECVCFWK
jgi:hypothetical protein